jgi:hypothetical protein
MGSLTSNCHFALPVMQGGQRLTSARTSLPALHLDHTDRSPALSACSNAHAQESLLL